MAVALSPLSGVTTGGGGVSPATSPTPSHVTGPLKLQILRSELRADPSLTVVVMHVIEVTTERSQWLTVKRFSQFYELDLTVRARVVVVFNGTATLHIPWSYVASSATQVLR